MNKKKKIVCCAFDLAETSKLTACRDMPVDERCDIGRTERSRSAPQAGLGRHRKYIAAVQRLSLRRRAGSRIPAMILSINVERVRVRRTADLCTLTPPAAIGGGSIPVKGEQPGTLPSLVPRRDRRTEGDIESMHPLAHAWWMCSSPEVRDGWQ